MGICVKLNFKFIMSNSDWYFGKTWRAIWSWHSTSVAAPTFVDADGTPQSTRIIDGRLLRLQNNVRQELESMESTLNSIRLQDDAYSFSMLMEDRTDFEKEIIGRLRVLAKLQSSIRSCHLRITQSHNKDCVICLSCRIKNNHCDSDPVGWNQALRVNDEFSQK